MRFSLPTAAVFSVVAISILTSGCMTERVTVKEKEREWQTIAELTFDDSTEKDLPLYGVDHGLARKVEGGEFVLAGRTTDTRWRDDGLNLPVTGDTRAVVEISFSFRIASCPGYHLVDLDAETNEEGNFLCMFFEGYKGKGHYRIQLGGKTKLKFGAKLLRGTFRTEGFGDETTKLHTMRVVHDRATSQTSYYADSTLLGVVQVNGDIAPITTVLMGLETPEKGTDVDIRFDNLRVRVAGPPYQPDHKPK